MACRCSMWWISKKGIRIGAMPAEHAYSRRCWFTFPSANEVEQPIIWQMSRKFPKVIFDIRQASVHNAIGIMAVLFSGGEKDVQDAIEFVRRKGGKGEPIGEN